MGFPKILRLMVLLLAFAAQVALCADEPLDATPGAPTNEVKLPDANPAEPDKKTTEPNIPETVVPPAPDAVKPAAEAPPPRRPAHIALLLPLKSATFGRAAIFTFGKYFLALNYVK